MRCREAGVRPSMGSVGDCFDNAMCESFFATLECELLDRRRFHTQAAARMALFEFIEGWYNPHRRHSALDYLSPINYERSHDPSSQPQALRRPLNRGNSKLTVSVPAFSSLALLLSSDSRLENSTSVIGFLQGPSGRMRSFRHSFVFAGRSRPARHRFDSSGAPRLIIPCAHWASSLFSHIFFPSAHAVGTMPVVNVKFRCLVLS